MVFNAIFNHIPVISWWSVLLVEESRVPGENHRPTTDTRKTACDTNNIWPQKRKVD